MSAIKIAHLSDLHFKPGKSLAVWDQVVQYINEKVKPHLILVTGDVTDNASHREFELARDQLKKLGRHAEGDPLAYRIVPGNHDRFMLLGNTWKLLSFLGHFKDKSGRFAATFTERIVSVEQPCDLEIPGANSPWKLRIIGLDSNDAEQYFAQGYVSQPSIAQAATAARGRPDRDLVIALVHHHVLPIPQLEINRGSSNAGLKLLTNVTGLLNSGSLLNFLSTAHVDLVLHGHEHMRNQARFGSLEDGASNLVVLAAGSGTGAQTGGGFELSRVHFNVIELDQDRSVWLQEIGYTDGGTLGAVKERRQLLTSQDIRQSRFVRRNRLSTDGNETRGFPRSRLRKLVRFHEQRDIEIIETRTDWVLSDVWTQVTRNSSGRLSPLFVECQWQNAPPTEYREEFFPKLDERDRFVGTVQFGGPATAKKVERVTSSWIWYGGGALTRADLDAMKATQSDPIRTKGREYAAVRAANELESLSIVVQLPHRYAPAMEDVEVQVEDPAKPGELTRFAELERASLDFCGRAIFELRVPFPMPHFVYYLTWPVCPNQPPASQERSQFGVIARKEVGPLMALATACLSHRLSPARLRVDLYVPSAEEDAILGRVSKADMASPAAISRRPPRGLGRLAWWGTPVCADREDFGEVADDADKEFCDDERILVVVPVRGSSLDTTDTLGLLRVGVRGVLEEAVLTGKPALDRLGLIELVADTANSLAASARQRY